MAGIEAILAKYPHLINVLGVLGTFFVAFVALYLARNAEKIKIKAHASIWLDTQDKEPFLAVRIINLGARKAFFGTLFCYWRWPFYPNNFLIMTGDTPPFALEPLTRELKKLQTVEQLRQEFLAKPPENWLIKFFSIRPGLIVYSEDGTQIKVKIEKGLKDELKDLMRQIRKKG